MIKTVEELKDFFHNHNFPENERAFVDSEIRKDWILNKERTIIAGKVYTMAFTDIKGGIWEVRLCDTPPNLKW